MYTFDTSSIIYAWENYPKALFPSLWNWMAEEIGNKRFTIPQCAFDECGHNAPDCQSWLSSQKIYRHPQTQSIIQVSLLLKTTLNIRTQNDYHAKGVDENDLIIIATAKEISCTLVSNEAIQIKLPPHMPRYKIPAVCDLAGVKVPCMTFLDLLNQEGPDFASY